MPSPSLSPSEPQNQAKHDALKAMIQRDPAAKGAALTFEAYEELLEQQGAGVTTEGFVEFTKLTPDLATAIGDLPVLMSHLTTHALLSKSRELGLLANASAPVATDKDLISRSPRIALHPNRGSPTSDQYRRLSNFHAAEPTEAAVVVRLSEMTAVPADATDPHAPIEDGTLFALPYVPPNRVLQVAPIPVIRQALATAIDPQWGPAALTAYNQRHFAGAIDPAKGGVDLN